MKISWTAQQEQVIKLQNRNILVSAAAGSGKTAVLVERIIQMLLREEDPVSVDELLIVTFTEAAAAEMKERIRSAIEAKLEVEPENEHLAEQATLIHNAMITTIHSFCLSVIRDHFHDIDLNPGFRVGEEGEMKLLRHDVLDELLESCYQDGRKEFLEFAECYGSGKSDKKIEDLVLKLYDYSRSYPNSRKWLENCEKIYDVETKEDMENSPVIQFIEELAVRTLEDVESILKSSLAICHLPDGPYFYEQALEKEIAMIKEIKEIKGYAELSAALNATKFPTLTGKRKGDVADEEKTENAKKLRNKAKDHYSSLKTDYFYLDHEGMIQNMSLCKRAVSELVRLVLAFAEAFEEKKRSQNIIDFSDMEQYAFRILSREAEDGFVPSDSAREYQKQFREIMIDEYQDSNDIQEAILTSVSTVSEGKNNVFMVGDVKQSIYRFRLAKPELFMKKFHSYKKEDAPEQRIDLPKNFRSRREVVDSVNFFFEQLMTPKLGGITYDENAALHVGAQYEDGPGYETEILFMKKSDTVDVKELEGRMVAEKIRQIVGTQLVTDKATKKLRPARYSDIVILLRTMKGYGDKYQEILKNSGIPACTTTGDGYFSTKEIRLVLDYLRVLDNRMQDLPLTAVLASPVGGLTDEELAKIRCMDQEHSFAEAVEAYRLNGEDEVLRAKLEGFYDVLNNLRELVPYTPMHELLEEVLKQTGYKAYVSALEAGTQKLANLDVLKEKAASYEQTCYKGLFHFVRYIEKLEKYDVDYGEAVVDDESMDAVRIMSIHKSKGLEFPIVFVSSMNKKFNLSDARATVVVNSKLGIGVDGISYERRTKMKGLARKVISNQEGNETLAEELRVLYVALTRAKEKLIMTSIGEELDDASAVLFAGLSTREERELPYYILSKSDCYSNWIRPALELLTEEIPIRVQYLTEADLEKQELSRDLQHMIDYEAFQSVDTKEIRSQEFRDHLNTQFSFIYPYKDSLVQKQKYSVSELKKSRFYEILQEDESPDMESHLFATDTEIPVPRFRKEKEETSGAQRGTNYHRVLELIDFQQTYTRETLLESIIKWEENGLLEKGATSTIYLNHILHFLDSEYGKRMAKAQREGKLHKEQPFVLGVPAKELVKETQSEELSLVQGIIDVYFEEEEGIVLLDYKTDRVDSEEELRKRYSLQLEIYAQALEQLTGKKVTDNVMYSFALEKSVNVTGP